MYYFDDRPLAPLQIKSFDVNLNSLSVKEKLALASTPFTFQNWVRLVFSHDDEAAILNSESGVVVPSKSPVECLYYDTLYRNPLISSITEFKCNPAFHTLGDNVIVLAVALCDEMSLMYKLQHLIKITVDHHGDLWGKQFGSYVIAVHAKGALSWDISYLSFDKYHCPHIKLADAKTFVRSNVTGSDVGIQKCRVVLKRPFHQSVRIIG